MQGKDYKIVGGNHTKTLLTKREIMSFWLEQSNIDQPCCPYCRDELQFDHRNRLTCENVKCQNKERYIALQYLF